MAGRWWQIGERRGGKIERARLVDTSPCGRLRWIREGSWGVALLRGTSGRGLYGGGDSGIVRGSWCGNDTNTRVRLSIMYALSYVKIIERKFRHRSTETSEVN